MELILWCVVPMVITFICQFLCCCYAKNRLLRRIPLLICLVPFILAVIALFSDSGFFIGAEALLAAFYAIVGICCLVGYGIAWGVYKFKNRKTVDIPNNKSES